MIRQLKSLFTASGSKDIAESREKLVQLAAAALLIELGRADDTIDTAETESIAQIAGRCFNLSDEDTRALLDEASEKNAQATSLYEFTDIINSELNKQDKIELVKNMWVVAYADGRIDRYEDHLIRKVAELVYVSHSEFIRAKHQANPANE